ncbi:hypothetical protein CHUAL_012541 [Chamberlinius hualienensis]
MQIWARLNIKNVYHLFTFCSTDLTLNYLQSDICHAYQVLQSHGVTNIITMMYDDIANNSQNPFPGKIFNKPGYVDVYHGVKKDYTGSDVTSKNFLNVLLGDESAMTGIGSGRVLKSGPNDHVFIFYSDHGATGLVSFPNGGILYANDFIATLKEMNRQGLYGEMTIYMESCESGSMFDGLLPNNINIYVTTASNPYESSYACYWSNAVGAYLGDLYSVNWMENSDENDLTVETLAQQFQAIVANTDSSHPNQYGTMSISKEVVGRFLGMGPSSITKTETRHISHTDAVPTAEVTYEILKHKLQSATDEAEKQHIAKEIEQLLKNRQLFTEKLSSIMERSVIGSDIHVERIISTRQQLNLDKYNCYKEVTQHFSTHCYPIGQNEFVWKHLYVFANMCQMNIQPFTMKIAMNNVCQQMTTGVD